MDNNALFPNTFAIETVLGCNLGCVECAVGAGIISRSYGVMPLDKYEIIMRDISRHAEYVYLYFWGEYLLNKHILDMVKMTNVFAKTNLSTNANFIDEEFSKKIIDSCVSCLIVSIDGMTYAYLRCIQT